MEMKQQTVGGSDLTQERRFQGKTLETYQHKVRGSDLAPKMALLKARYGVNTVVDSDMQDELSPPPYYLTQNRPPESHGTQRLESPMSTDIWDEVV